MDESQSSFLAWTISLILHGVVVALTFLFVAQVKPVLQENVFQWDVALVEEAAPIAAAEHAESIVPPDQPQEKSVRTSRTNSLQETIQSQKPVLTAEQKTAPPPPMIESIQRIEQNEELPRLHEESAEQQLVDAAQEVFKSMESEPLAVVASPEMDQFESASPLSASTMPLEAPISPEVSEPEVTPPRVVDTAPVLTAKVPESGQKLRMDHRWLAESLWKRVAELKRYPNTSRMNGEEGKVILKAVIRSDGQLADVSVQKSSGYSALDEAAMEAVKLACPLHMQHALGKPQIVVSLPIVYRLAN